MKKIIHGLLLMAVSFSVFSCVLEKEFDDIGTATTEKAEVILRLKTPSGYSSPSSRSLTYSDENTISDVYVLVFDNTNTLVNIKQGTHVSSSSGHTSPSYSGEGAFTVTLGASKTTSDTYNLVVLANAQSVISGTIGFDVSAISNKSYSDVMAAISGQISGPMYSFGGTIPMWGESGQLVISSGSNNQTLQLTRSLARIDVGVGKATKDDSTDIWTWDGKDASNASIPFRLGHVYVIKPNNRYAVVPDGTKAAGNPTVPAGTAVFSFSDSESNFAFAATASGTGGYTSRDIYVPEADIKMGTGAMGDANHTKRMAIVVGGYYNGNATETFYRIDFAVDGSLVNVLRNHLYQFNISKVSGDGYPDVETAYNSQSMNMTVNIYEWNETDMGNIAFDGQNILCVSRDQYYFSYDEKKTEHEDNVLYVMTDYTTTVSGAQSGWYIEEIVDAADITSSVRWLTLSKTSGAAFDKTAVTLMVDKNSSTTGRSAIVRIAAGRLRYTVTVTQAKYQLTWARSNIVFVPGSNPSDPTDGGYLTFAVTPVDNTMIPANSQGVFFQWGSLVAISPAPLTGTSAYTQGKYPSGHILFSPTGTYDYEYASIPYISELTGKFGTDLTSEDDFAGYGEDGSGFNATAGKGDICRYISQDWVSGSWRLPTADEIDQLIQEGDASTDGFSEVTVSSDDTNAYGYYECNYGRWLGEGASTSSGVASPSSGVFVPAGGCRATNGATYYAGSNGCFWSGSSTSSTFGYNLSVISSTARRNSYDRQASFPVRCVRE